MKENIAEVNTTSKLSDMKEQLQRIGIKTESFPSVLTSEWENHAPSMVSTSQAFPTTTNNFLKSIDLIDLKCLDHETEQQDMTATCTEKDHPPVPEVKQAQSELIR